MSIISSIYRYPVKGLTAEQLETTKLETGKSLAFDRYWAIENGTRDFDPENPRHMPKRKFLQICEKPKLALLDCSFDQATQRLTINLKDAEPVSAVLSTQNGTEIIEAFIANHMPSILNGAPRMVSAKNHSFSDIREDAVSIINLASVEDISRIAGQEIDPLRFRGNIYLQGLEPWEEMNWVGKKVSINNMEMLDVFAHTGRCPATHINLQTGSKDIDLLETMNDAFGHTKCGLYAMVSAGGQISTGDKVKVA